MEHATTIVVTGDIQPILREALELYLASKRTPVESFTAPGACEPAFAVVQVAPPNVVVAEALLRRIST